MEHQVNRREKIAGLERLHDPGLGPLLVALIILHFGLSFLILMIFSAAHLRFGQLREVWNPIGYFGTSAFELCILIVTLLVFLVVVDAWCLRRRTSRLAWFHVVGYLSCVVLVGFIARNLYEFAEIPLNDEWYYAQIKDEPIDVQWIQLGWVLKRGVSGCRVAAEDCLLVELVSGEDAAVAVKPDIFGDRSPIVAIEVGWGRFSGKETFQAYSYVPVEDAALYWRAERRKRGGKNGT